MVKDIFDLYRLCSDGGEAMEYCLKTANFDDLTAFLLRLALVGRFVTLGSGIRPVWMGLHI